MAPHHSEPGSTMLPHGSGARWRVLQFLTALTVRCDPLVDLRLRAAVHSDAQWALLQRLTPFDRSHHLQVYDALRQTGHSDPDLLLAGALHDVGKADARGRVWLVHRVARVLLAKLAPDSLSNLSDNGNALMHGLYLCVRHASLGAQLAEAAGASSRCCELIARHEENAERVADPGLLALIKADQGARA